MHFNMIDVLATVFVQILVATHPVTVNAQLGSVNMSTGISFGAAADINKIASEMATRTMKMGTTAIAGVPGFDVANKMMQGSTGFPAGNSFGAAAGMAAQMVSEAASQAGARIASEVTNAVFRASDIANKMKNTVRIGAGGAAATIGGKFSMNQPPLAGGTNRDYTVMPLARDPRPTATYRPMAPTITITGNV